MAQNTQDLIDKFWAGTATAAEQQQLAAQLDARPGEWSAALRRAYDQQLARPETGPLSEAQAARVLSRLHQQLRLDEAVEAAVPAARLVWRGWPQWAAAALLAVGLLLGWYRFGRPVPAVQVAAVRPAPPAAAPLVTRTNPGAAPLALPLADGSVLTLQPGSTVRYYAPFGRAGRGISLTGSALFKVAKDARHPFTVLANGFTTTALGTKFRVLATAPGRVTVRLLEGKVVVRATPASGLTMREHFLTPGQELTVSTRTRQVSVRSFEAVPAPRRPLTVEVPTGLTFEKDDLAEVLAQVQARYHVRIAYDSADVRGLSFSGAFEPSDPLPVVLRAVCSSNNLTFTQTPGQVIIRKSP